MMIGLLPALGDEQGMLVETSVRFIDDRHPLATVRAHAESNEPVGPGYCREVADLGWFGLLADERHGGGSASGKGLTDAALIAVERGARLQPGPYVGHNVVVHALSTPGSPALLEPLAALIAGHTWATWAFAESPAVEARAADEGVLLHGRVDIVADAGMCGWLLVTASGPDGTVQALVSATSPGLTCRPLVGLDVTRSWFAIDLDGVAVPASHIVGSPGALTDQQVRRQVQTAAVLASAESVGAMEADFAMALQYAKDRIAFGRPIGSFQAIKHILADTSLGLEMSKAIVAAAAAAGQDAAEGGELAHAAKSFVGETSIELAHSCFQVFGGIGYTWEHDQHLFLRRLAADAATFGSPSWHRAQLLARGLDDEQGGRS